MRIEASETEEAWMYIFAETNLSKFTHRIDVEVPYYEVTTTHTIDISVLESSSTRTSRNTNKLGCLRVD